jgi:hypothetical protein
MHGTAVLARVALVTLLVLGCATPADESSEPSGFIPIPTVSPRPASTPAPTSDATVGEHLLVSWEPLDELMELEDWGEALAHVFHDGERWVAFYCAEHRHGCLATLVSEDARTWTPASLAGVTSLPQDFAIGPDGWVITGNEPGSPRRLEIWRSADASTWTRDGAFPSRYCTRLACHYADSLAVAPSGAIVIGSTRLEFFPSESSTGPYVSIDGVDWTSIGLEGLGVEAFKFSSIQSAPGGLVLVGTACEGCDLRMWRSNDGLAWEDFGEITSSPTPASGLGGHVAAIGAFLLASVAACDDAPSGCRIELWGREADAPWTLRGTLPDLGLYQLAVIDAGPAGPAFLAVAETYQSRLVSLVSIDGATWPEVPSIGGPSIGEIEECEYSRDVTIAAGIIVLNAHACGVWRGTLELQP